MRDLPLFCAVVHVASDSQAVEQTGVAFENGAGGVFLIDHGRGHVALKQTYKFVRAAYPSKFIGINFLDLGTVRALQELPGDADALWMDGCAAGDTMFFSMVQELEIKKHILMGACFKYQGDSRSPEEAAIRVAADGYVPCTSGPGTGMEAPLEKIRRMKEAIGQVPLALASGVTPENVDAYLPHVDCLLVATGISFDHHTLDPAKVAILAQRVRAHQAVTNASRVRNFERMYGPRPGEGRRSPGSSRSGPC